MMSKFLMTILDNTPNPLKEANLRKTTAQKSPLGNLGVIKPIFSKVRGNIIDYHNFYCPAFLITKAFVLFGLLGIGY